MTGETQSSLFDVPNGGGVPLVNPDDAPAVIAYRLGQVETSNREILNRFDRFAELYVSTPALLMHLEPIKSKVKELEDHNKEREQKKASETSQFRLAITIAVLSPVFNIVVAVLLNKGSS